MFKLEIDLFCYDTHVHIKHTKIDKKTIWCSKELHSEQKFVELAVATAIKACFVVAAV